MILLTVIASPASAPPWSVDIECAYHDAIVAQLKAHPGIVWDPRARIWRGPAEAVRIVTATLEAAGVAKCRWLAPNAPSAIVSSGLAHEAVIMADHETPLGLRPYQIDGASWLRHTLRHTGGALLADEMGVGKTPTTIAALDAACPAGRILIICPAVVVGHWERQITQWSTRFGVLNAPDVPEGATAAQRREVAAANRRWHVASYGTVSSLPRDGVAAIALDEIHYLASPGAKRSAAVVDLIADCEQHAGTRPPVIGLSGTPMTARPVNLWHPLQLLHPGRWGSKWQFERRFCNGHYEEIHVGGGTRNVWVADGVSNTAELASRLQHVMLRRTKSQVATEMPPLTRQVIEVELPSRARTAVAAAAVAATDDRMRMGALLSAVEEHKIAAAIDLARDAIAAGSKPLVLTLRKETAHQIGGALMSPVVTGDVPAHARQEALEAPGAPAGVATLYSVTTGIDLVSYDAVILVGLDWIPSTMLQGEARLHRFTQQKPVTAYYLVGLGTIDEVVRERVIDRLDTFAALTGGDATGGFGETLKGGTEDELLASLVAAVMAA